MVLLQNSYQIFCIVYITYIVIRTHMSSTGETACKHRTTCWTAGRHNRIRLIKPGILVRQFIDVRSDFHRKTFTPTQIRALLICHYHHNIGLICLSVQGQAYPLENNS